MKKIEVNLLLEIYVQKSSGKYIFFMDVDDSISKNSLSSLYEFTLEDDYDYIFSDFQRIEDFQNQRGR